MKSAASHIILLLAGLLPFSPGGTAEAQSWSQARSLSIGRHSHTATLLLDGRVLVAGGADGLYFWLPPSEPIWSTTTSAETYDPATGAWRPTGSLAVARCAHTATLLPSGKVLVVGGKDASGAAIASAEIFDPAANAGAGRWTTTAPLGTAREQHTATLLPDGRVLVAGGHNGLNGAALSSAEIFDPAGNAGAGTWTTTALMNAARDQHTATLLPSGRVLVAGGAGGASAEIFEPAGNGGLGTWTPTGPLATARSLHTATRLPDGRVLVAGGFNGAALTSAEIYTPATGQWTTTGSLSTARHSQTAVLLPSGLVLAVAGDTATGDPRWSPPLSSAELYDPATGLWTAAASLNVARRFGPPATLLPSGEVLLEGGYSGSGNCETSAEIYEPATGVWSPTGSLDGTAGGYLPTATLLPGGKVLVAGGNASTQSWLSGAELYDPATGAWTPTGSLTPARHLHTATLLPSGKVLVAGGSIGVNAQTTSATIYDPATGTWSPTGSLNTPRAFHTATLLPSGRVLVAGGTIGAGDVLASAELYDPATGTWTPTGSLNTARFSHAATLLPTGSVLVTGGVGPASGGTGLSSAEIYDPATETWTAVEPMWNARTEHTASLLPSGKVLVAGGAAGPTWLSSAEVFDPATRAWSPTGSLNIARGVHTATLLPGGRILVSGGRNAAYLASAEIYDLATGTWTLTGSLNTVRDLHTATLLPSGRVLVAAGSNGDNSFLFSAEIYDPNAFPDSRRPVITGTSATVAYGTPLTITGTGFRGDSEAGGGATWNSSVNYPLVQVTAIENGTVSRLVPDPRPNFWDDPVTLTFSSLPATLDPGWYYLTVTTVGVPSVSQLIEVTCSVAITQQPASQTVALGATATFGVVTQGGGTYQWLKDGLSIPGVTGATYTTPPVTGADSGSTYQVIVGGPGCILQGTNPPSTTITSAAATLTVADSTPPTTAVLSPTGGEYWLLGSSQLVTWSMSDDIRICQVVVSLLFSNDGGASYAEVPNPYNLTPTGPAVFGPGGECPYPGEGTTSATYTVPTTFPSGVSGSLYKVRVVVTDHSGLQTPAESPNPFYIVQANPDSVRTLIFSNTARMQARMGTTPAQASALAAKLQELANNPKVQGLVVDLNGVTDLSDPAAGLYAAWDADASNPDKANNVLFGCHGPDLTPPQALPPGCTTVKNGIHDKIVELLKAYTGVKYVVLVGDDRIIPMARLKDNAVLFSESNYPAGGDLTAGGTTVGQALSANKYLSDDPLVVLDPVRSDQLNGSLYLPDLAVGRLVESPAEITTAIATFISQDGVLDLSVLDPTTGHQVLVTGYDFLTDSGKRIRERWKNAFACPGGVCTPDSSLAPVDGSLIGQSWDDVALRTHLGGSGGQRYGVMSVSGHATHYAEGAPGADFRFGLKTQDIYGTDACVPPTTSLGALNLAGGVVYAVGCHGGLPVPGSCATDLDHSLDLPQTMLSRGVVAYVANTGYGWGLKFGVGYSERLVQLLTDEMTKGGTVVTGDAVRRTKQRYFLETPRYDPYDEKSLMQWTFYGLPMYAVKTRIAASALTSSQQSASFEGPAPKAVSGTTLQQFGGVSVARDLTSLSTTLPSFVTLVNLHFDFTASGVYGKLDSAGNTVTGPGCSDPNGCYWTLNGLSTGATDLPLQPYFIYDSRLSGTSQHGVLWKGGTYDEESGWKPVFAELQSNGGDGSNHGTAPRTIKIKATSQRVVPGLDPDTCRASDIELNSTLVDAGEALKAQDTDLDYTIERHYRTVDLEVFYFNNSKDPSQNCDRDGPTLGAGPFGGNYHQVSGGTIAWSVPVTDVSGVWRVLVVFNDNTASGGQGVWTPLDLVYDGATNTWRGSHAFGGSLTVTYVVQAVDNRGNVRWLDYVTTQAPLSIAAAQAPSSGVPLSIARPVDAAIAAPPAPTITGFNPASGLAGTSVLITGGGFTGATAVSFGGVGAPFVVSSDAAITALVPTYASTGPITVTTPSGTAVSATSFAVSGPTVSIADASVAEGNSGTTNMVFTVTLSASSSQTVDVGYRTVDATATAGSDYTAVSGTLTLAPGATSATITVPVTGDVLNEADETLFLNLTSATAAAIGVSQAAGTILNDDPLPLLTINDAIVAEGKTGTLNAVFTVSLLPVSGRGVTVGYATGGGTATAGTDYAATSGTLSFAPGSRPRVEQLGAGYGGAGAAADDQDPAIRKKRGGMADPRLRERACRRPGAGRGVIQVSVGQHATADLLASRDEHLAVRQQRRGHV